MTKVNWGIKFKRHLEQHNDRILLFRECRAKEDNMYHLNRIRYHQAPGIWAWSYETFNGREWTMKCSEKWEFENYWGRRSLFGHTHER